MTLFVILKTKSTLIGKAIHDEISVLHVTSYWVIQLDFVMSGASARGVHNVERKKM